MGFNGNVGMSFHFDMIFSQIKILTLEILQACDFLLRGPQSLVAGSIAMGYITNLIHDYQGLYNGDTKQTTCDTYPRTCVFQHI